MKSVHVFGPQAVGKMTVGQELAKITDLKLFHNHMTIDLVSHFFDYSTQEGKRLVNFFRQEILEEVSKSNLYGIVFTMFGHLICHQIGIMSIEFLSFSDLEEVLFTMLSLRRI